MRSTHTRSTHMRSTLKRSICHEINSHEINSHEINSHEINSQEINYQKINLPWDQVNFLCYHEDLTNILDLVKILVKLVLNQHASISQISKVLEMQVSQGWFKEKLHVLVRLLMSQALNTIIHQIRHHIRPRSWFFSDEGTINTTLVFTWLPISNWALG